MTRFSPPPLQLLCACLGLLLQACSTTAVQPNPPPLGQVSLPLSDLVPSPLPARPPGEGHGIGSEIAIRAIALLGAPYVFGGDGPAVFDCSGLVSFIHNELGIEVPRTAADQYHAATPIDLDEVEPGDLLFFRTRGKQISHVAIYAGSGRFVHAPQTGRPIEITSLDNSYYRKHFAGAGRLFD